MALTNVVWPTLIESLLLRLRKWKRFCWLLCYRSQLVLAIAGDPSVKGDVVARDLSAGPAWVLGHTGLWSGSRVIEALNHPTKSVQSNSLSSFKAADDYWGARYWSDVSSNALTITVGTAINQAQYGSSYTFTPIVRPTTNRKPSQFRCDSLVAYSFYKGAGKTYPNVRPSVNSFGSTPTQVYNFTGKTSGGARS